jgi:hypothetical protein
VNASARHAVCSAARDDGQIETRGTRSVVAQIDGFVAEAIDEEAERLGISADELVSFSVLYYLADVDSGRISRKITSQHPVPAIDTGR